MNNWKQSYKRPERHKIYQDAIEEYERTWKQYGRHCTLEQHRSLKACYSKIVETFRTFKDSPLSPALTKKFKADKSTSVKPGKFKAFKKKHFRNNKKGQTFQEVCESLR